MINHEVWTVLMQNTIIKLADSQLVLILCIVYLCLQFWCMATYQKKCHSLLLYQLLKTIDVQMTNVTIG